MNRGIFGGGAFSVHRSYAAKRVGTSQKIYEIDIPPVSGAFRQKNGRMKYNLGKPFLPTTFREKFCNGANSLVFAIQVAHLLQADPIYAVGFTLQSGTGYFYGRNNAVRNKPAEYEGDLALEWCRWFEKSYPGRVKLDPLFSGPIYDVFKRATDEELQGMAKK